MTATKKMYDIIFPKMECTMIHDYERDDNYSGNPVPEVSEVVFLPFKFMPDFSPLLMAVKYQI